MDDVFPYIVWTFGGIGIEDTVLATWAIIVLVISAVALVKRRWPAALESLIEFLSDSTSLVMGRPAEPFLPLLATLAVFVGAANSAGIFPGLRAPTRSINTTAALALVVFGSVHYYGIRARGLRPYLRGLADPVFLLPLEIIGQFSRTFAMALRLFGNVLSAEMIVAVIFSIVPLFVPLPLIGLSLLTGLLQAYILTVLAAVYVGAAVGASDPIPNGRSS